MKKILLGSVVLTAFSLAIIAFQLSCQKTVLAESTSGSKPLNVVIYEVVTYTPVYGLQIWAANTDGTNPHQIPITLPAGYMIGYDSRLSPDGKTVVFDVAGDGAVATMPNFIYTCSLDGSNLKQIIQMPSGANNLQLEGTY